MNPLQPASDFRKKWKLEIELDLGTFWNHRQDDAALSLSSLHRAALEACSLDCPMFAFR